MASERGSNIPLQLWQRRDVLYQRGVHCEHDVGGVAGARRGYICARDMISVGELLLLFAADELTSR